MTNKILSIFGFLNKAMDKIPDGDIREQAKVQIKELEIMLLIRMVWIIGLAVLLIYVNFFYKITFMPGYYDNITQIKVIEITLLLLATKFIFNLSIKAILGFIKEIKKFYKEFWKK